MVIAMINSAVSFVQILALDLLLLKTVLSNPYTSGSLLLQAERRSLHGQPMRAAAFHVLQLIVFKIMFRKAVT